MTSHELAAQLKETADYLLARESVEISHHFLFLSFTGMKKEFVAAVRAMLPGKKEIGDYDVAFKPKGTILTLSINKSAVCRKIQDVKYECDPILSPEEESLMEEQETL